MQANPNYTYLKERIAADRVINLQGSTRSGKTYSIIYFLIDLCRKYDGLEIDITRDTFKALKATVWKDFINVMLKHGIYDPNDHNKTDGIYTLWGNTINYFGSDSTDKVHGKSRDILWVNEAQHMDGDVIDQLYPRTRYRIINDFNPALGEEHWLDKYIEQYPPLITTYKDNPYLTREQVADIESRKDNKYWWSVYGLGERAKVEGAVFTNWERGKFPNTPDYWFGMDFGWSNDPTALVKVFIDKRERIIYAKEEVYESYLTTSQIGDLCTAKCGKSLILADSAEPRLIAELKSKRINIQAVKKTSVVEGVVLMSDYKLVVEGDNIAKELSKYRWVDKGKTVPIDDFNHAIDALRYGVTFKLINPNYGKYAIG